MDCACAVDQYIHRRMLIFRLTQIIALSLLLVACVDDGQVPGDETEDSYDLSAPVARVIDGDTFVLSGVSPRIRVWGLDAPEWNHRGGSAATAAMRGLVSGKALRCRVRDIDRYGRYVGQCFLPDGRDITAEMIKMGVATEYCYFSKNYYRTCR